MELTADEVALYDRQIRLWGTDTQLRLRSAKILLINLGAVGTEVIKNLVLGGLNTIEILDDSVVREEDFASQFFLPNDTSIVGTPKLPHVEQNIKDLNPRVNLSINTSHFESQSPEYYLKFDLVVATELKKAEMLALNDVTRSLKIPLYVAGLHGMFGYILTDLISHESIIESEIGNQSRSPGPINDVKSIVKVDVVDKKEMVTVRDHFTPLRDIFSLKKMAGQLNRRQLKRLKGALPLIFALFDVEDVSEESLKAGLLAVCDNLGLPRSAVTDEYVGLFASQAFTGFAPTAAIVGGFLAQDIIQFLGKKESPINNCFILDAVLSEMPIYYL